MGIMTDDMKRVVREQRLGFIATVNADGSPALSHAGTMTVWDDDHLVFANIRSPRTVANIQRSSLVEVEVVDPIIRKGYRFKGTGAELSEGEQHDEIIRLFEEERSLEAAGVRSVVLIEVTDARPVISPAYDSGATEDDVRASWQRYWAALGSR
jgi:hypothetical protein